MAPIKRKDASRDYGAVRKPFKRPRVDENERTAATSKRSRKGTEEASQPSDQKVKTSNLSVIRDEEPLFPRGGGSVLTAVEKKQIQNQATRDVLFEQKGAGRAGSRVEVDDQDEDVAMSEVDENVAVQKKYRKSKTRKRSEGETNHKASVRIEGLSFKVRSSSLGRL